MALSGAEVARDLLKARDAVDEANRRGKGKTNLRGRAGDLKEQPGRHKG